MPFKFMSSISPTLAFNKDAFPKSAAYIRPPDQIIQPAKTSLTVLHDGFA
jgi:hypothetical protein